MLLENDTRAYNRSDLRVFDLLKHPVWVFDIEQKSMYWANRSALDIWNATSLEALLRRDFHSDMTASTERRLQEHLAKMVRGEIIQEQWTFYPKGKTATTICVTESAIRIEGNRIGNLVEAELPDGQSVFENNTVRGVEMLRHVPLPICQFSIDGKLVYQNPEAVHLFGIADGEEATSNNDNDHDDCPHFLSRFVDQELGRTVLQNVQAGQDCSVEAEQYTKDRTRRWFSVAARRTRDPVTTDNIILYSARDITEIIQARLDTKQANLKSEFMSVIAHEIRTPLHQIVGFVDLLELTELSEQQVECVRVVQSSTQLLMSIINDLLDYSKLECGKLQIETVKFDLKGVVDGCLDAIKANADDKGLKLQCQLPPNVEISLLGDPNRLRQILLNLLSNAVKFTAKGGISLTVRVVENKRRIRFEVTDTGMGIDPAQHHVVFEPYRQASASMTRQFGGTGLGLAICKRLVDEMGGSIDLHSELDQGTTIFVELPFQIPTPDKVSILPGKPDKLLPEEETVERFHVLVAEDNTMNQKLACSMLQRIGHQVTIVENGQLALEALQQQTFDVVLMDVQM